MNELNLTALRIEREELCNLLDSLTGEIQRDGAEMWASGDAEGINKLEAAETDLMARIDAVERCLRLN